MWRGFCHLSEEVDLLREEPVVESGDDWMFCYQIELRKLGLSLGTADHWREKNSIHLILSDHLIVEPLFISPTQSASFRPRYSVPSCHQIVTVNSAGDPLHLGAEHHSSFPGS